MLDVERSAELGCELSHVRPCRLREWEIVAHAGERRHCNSCTGPPLDTPELFTIEMSRLLLVDDDAQAVRNNSDILCNAGHEVVTARHVGEALHILESGGIDLIITEHRLQGITGLEFLDMLQRDGHEVPLIMLTGHGSTEHAVAAIKAGAADYLSKPVRPQQLEMAVQQALEVVRLRRENEALRQQVSARPDENEVLGESAVIRRLMQTVSMAAPTRATILLQGESGTGKELFARAIHARSDRHDKPFIKLNCAALPEGLIESALFGHEKGAFTGAVKRVEGAFERAHRGTLLLDEISEMRLDLQAKLLRVLQEQEFERVGGTSPIRVDVRIIATTNRDLAEAVAAGTFRQDLYYRLSTIPLMIAPLRERVEDVAPLAYAFAVRAAAEVGKGFEGIAPEVVQQLRRYPWPGNVRELQHVIERAVILSPEPMLGEKAFDPERFGLSSGLDIFTARRLVRRAGAAGAAGGVASGPGLNLPSDSSEMHVDSDAVVLNTLNVADAERVLIERALEAAGNNRTRAAELLGMSVRTLRNKLNGPAVA